MSGHGNKQNKMKGIIHVQTCIHTQVNQKRTIQINPISSQQSRRSDSAASSDYSSFFARQKSSRNCSIVGCNHPNGTTNNSSFQCRRTERVSRQTTPWPPGEGHRPICSPTQGGGSNLSEGPGLSIQFLDTESTSRISWPADRQVAESPLFVATNGQAWNCISPSKARNGSSARSQRLQRKEGFIGVFKKRATERKARFDLLYLDECEVHLHPTLTKVWTLKGIRPLIPAAGKNRKLCLYGAFNYKTGQVHYMMNPKKNADCFTQFLRQLLSANKNRFLVLALDNASYHRTSEILDLLTEHEDHVFVV